MRNHDGDLLCDTVEDLHQWLEDNAVWDYELPRKMTDEERANSLKELFS